jgi:hypothetical protein
MGLTVVRTIMRVRWEPTNLADTLTLGITVVDALDEFDDIQPNVNQGGSWALWTRDFPSASGPTVDAAHSFNVDLKSRRKLPSMNSRYVAAFETSAGTVRLLSYYARTLVLLP